MDTEIGSLETGKITDLVILDKNHLEVIQNSSSVAHTIINGRLYNTETMNEIGNYDQPRGASYWEQNGYSPSFDWHETGSVCSCGIRH